ncbi:HU family DNA-binding protein [Mycoplasmopsis alligatoris]|uniref:DNA-binding protein HU n=1 Tax=Mycoplasmopsis alligatoris A21JP2 TaxID=747682 RepID=D4XVG3_9BACT|nr:HU family DNA-binding protein [Mycoplasmopsis alligatoris]EFF41676.1 DNA-binding protein HU [Mycoplasmopsis alligatoris A21JP2]
MTKKEFVMKIANKTGYTVKEVNKFFDAFVFYLKEELIGEEKVQLSTLGTFSTQIKRKRETKNAFTGENISIPERRVVRFRPSKYLREIVDLK